MVALGTPLGAKLLLGSNNCAASPNTQKGFQHSISVKLNVDPAGYQWYLPHRAAVAYTASGSQGTNLALARNTRRSTCCSPHRLPCTCAAVKGYIKLALDAGKANPAPPVGPALGAKVT